MRRRWPLLVFAVTFGATLGHAALARDAINTTLGFLVALFTVGEFKDRRTSGIAALTAMILLAALIAISGTLPASLTGLVQTELAVALGVGPRNVGPGPPRRQLGTAEERAGRLEREREERDAPGGRRGAGADRPRAARRRDPPRERHRHPGRRRR